MRASLPRCRTSCRGKMQRLATEREAARIMAQTMSSACRNGLEIGLQVDALLFAGVFEPPAEGGVVVVGAGVDDGVGDVADGAG